LPNNDKRACFWSDDGGGCEDKGKCSGVVEALPIFGVAVDEPLIMSASGVMIPPDCGLFKICGWKGFSGDGLEDFLLLGRESALTVPLLIVWPL